MSTPAYDYDEIWRSAYGDMQTLGPVHRHMRRGLTKLLDGLDYGTAIDVGCGAGDNIALLARGTDLERITGADFSDEALGRAAKTWPQIDLVKLDIEKERLERRWDLVFSSLVLEHLPDADAAIENMFAMTGRKLLVTTICGDFERYRPWEEQMGHVRNYARGELEAKLERARFRIEQARYWGFPFYSPLVRRLQNGTEARSQFSRAQVVAAKVLNTVYYLNLPNRGDLLTVLASR